MDDVLSLFPGGVNALPNYSNEEVSRVINDSLQGGRIYQKTKLCLYGTTALVALVDPEYQNLWVANLGDSKAGAYCL